MAKTALLIGGTGPTGPAIARGLEARGLEVTVLHSGNHEVPEVAHLRHLHGDVFSDDGLRDVLGDETFDVAIANYGRLRSIADVLSGRTGRLLSIGGVPVYRGFFDPAVHHAARAAGADRVRTPSSPPRTTTARATASAAPSRCCSRRTRPPPTSATRTSTGPGSWRRASGASCAASSTPARS